MWIMILITLSAYVLLAYMIPFMKSVRWIENTSSSYYKAYKWVEDSLFFVKNRNLLTQETQENITWPVWYFYRTFSSWTTIPIEWYWNSEFSSWFNMISHTEPLQLEIWWINNLWNQDINFIFKTPNIDELTSWDFSGSVNYPVINWILSSENDTLIASWTYLNGEDINNSTYFNTWNIRNQEWKVLSWSWFTFWDFYNNNCNWTFSWCTLKMSVLNELKFTDNKLIPYLEYKIIFPSWFQVPDRYTRIESYGKSYGFQKKLDVRVPQQTVNQAFDFTVFQ